MTEIGRTFIRIRPKFDTFRQEAEAGLRREQPGDVAVTVTADTMRADEQLRRFGDKLDAVRLKTATAAVDVNDRAATVKLAAVDAALDRLDRVRVNPRVDVDGVLAAEAQVESLSLQLDNLDRKVVRVGSAGGGGILNRLVAAGQGGFFGGRGLAIGALGSAAVPIGIAGAGAGASLLTPTVAGTIGGGLFLAATKSALTRVDKVQTKLDALDKRIATTSPTTTSGSPASAAQLSAAEQRLANAQVSGNVSSIVSAQQSLTALQGRGTTTTPNKAYEKLVQQRQALLNQLTPAERKAAEGTKDLERTWVHFQRQLEPESFKAVATGTDILTKGLKLALPLTKATGDEIDHLFKRADKALSDPFWKHFFNDFLAKEAPKAVDALGTSIGNVFTGIAHLAEDWAPLGHSFETDLVNITGRFDAWTQGQGPGAFVALVKQDGPVVVQAIQGIASGLVGVGKGLEPIGRIELQALTPVLDFIGELGKQHPEVITALGIAYLGVAGGLKAVAAVKGLQGVAATLGGLGRGGKPGVTGITGGTTQGLLSRGGNPAEPLYVFVVNENFKSPKGPSGPGGPASTVEQDAEHAAETGGVAGVISRLRKLGHGAVHRTIGAAGLYVAGDVANAALPGGAGHFVGNTLKAASLGYEIGGVPGAVTVGSLDAAGQGVESALSWASRSDAHDQAKAEASVITQLMANAKGLQNLERLNQIAANQVRMSGSVSQEVQTEIDGLTKALTAAGVFAKHAGDDIGTNLGLGLIQGISAQIPHATVAGKLLVDLTAKEMRLAAEQHSPSRVTFRIGQGLTDGLALGITANTVNATVAADRLVAQVTARVSTLVTNVKATQSSITSSLLSQTGFAGFTPATNSLGLPVAPTTAGIIAGLRRQDAGLVTLRGRLGREHRLGLSGAAEQEIIGLGLQQGGAYAASLSHASRVQLRSISDLLSDVHSVAAATSRDVTGDVYGRQIVTLLEEIRRLTKNNYGPLDRLENRLQAIAQEIRGAAHKASLR